MSAKEKLGLENLNAICARAEEYVESARESFDVCTSRAVARLNILSELCIPFVKIGGSFIAMKSGKGAEEAAEATLGIKKLGAMPKQTHSGELTFSGSTIRRETLIYKKVAETPRRSSEPALC